MSQEQTAPSADILATVAVRKPADYVDRYDEFVASTDEKMVLAGALSRLLRPGTILDIGAGRGDIPQAMGVDGSRYTAIEQHPDFTPLLREKGYQVIENLFPCAVPDTYDNTVMIHCLYDRKQCGVMIPAAWQTLRPDGRLLAVTYRDILDDYNRVLEVVDRRGRVIGDERFQYLRAAFGALGPLAVHKLTSHVYSRDIRGLAATLSFLATNNCHGTPQERLAIQKAIEQQPELVASYYQPAAEQYQFPIEHYALVIDKIAA